MSRKRRVAIVVSFVAFFICLALRVCFAIIPLYASPIPYLMARVDGGTIQSPNGMKYEVWFNDAGAMHSGAHWTWVVSNHVVFGKRVVEEGYLGPEHAVDGKAIDVQWDNNVPVIQFLPSRY